MIGNKILFICSLNWHRSKTAETIFSKNEQFEVKSAGIKQCAENPLTETLIDWADTIFVMEKNQENIIKNKYIDFTAKKNVVCLDIDDNYKYMDPDLISILHEKVTPYLQET